MLNIKTVAKGNDSRDGYPRFAGIPGVDLFLSNATVKVHIVNGVNYNPAEWPVEGIVGNQETAHNVKLAVGDVPLQNGNYCQNAGKENQPYVGCAFTCEISNCPIPEAQRLVPRWLLLGADFFCGIIAMELIIPASFFFSSSRIERSRLLLGILCLLLSVLFFSGVFALSHLVYS